MFKVADDLMQMIFITIDENETENQPNFEEVRPIETACSGCSNGCVGSCWNNCSRSGKNCSGGPISY